MKMKLNKIMLAVLASAFISGSALASTETDDMTVTATVAKACTLTVGALNFGAWDPRTDAVKDGTATVTSKCTADIPYTIHADAGLGTGATFALRSMQGVTEGNDDEPVYSLYTNSGHTQVWGDTTDSSVEIAGTTNGDDQVATIYGRIAADQSGMRADAAGYSDTVGITLTY